MHEHRYAHSSSDEQIEIIRRLMQGGWVDFHGEHYSFARLRMEPAPGVDVPIHVGGHSDAAMRRAALLGDGWIGAQGDRDHLAELITPKTLGHIEEVLEFGEAVVEEIATVEIPAPVST